ncbi:GHMP kinase [Ancylomarina euxinus]|uniref:GHMP kinase n=1 Tax=Ancylomarina euxinus TaxID=2283627 RepID=A0A425XZJ0_9BACT|nr:GYDIA family GHMP kinase [Ancylomarina euxinus]MCZ4695485.1 GYDIA family GHMP kinase [Ancylomarina euxinus]MUP15697.1 GHMP kinase [Ancylomarina euxinus]RRG20690.1 GHMP kinase [Ancylomarina euxinus]
MDQAQFFYSNGKLLITAEYLVLKGALSLAVPTQHGQSLSVYPKTNEGLIWQAFENDEQWLKFHLNKDDLLNPTEDFSPEKTFIAQLLKQALALNPNFLNASAYRIETHLNFNRNWGLGTSSTLINNVAQWAQVDAFDLLARVSKGSGYDVACAQNDTPILFQRLKNKIWTEACIFSPEFKDQIYFLYLGKKQKTENEVRRFLTQKKDYNLEIQEISSLSLHLLDAELAVDFDKIIEEHEAITSNILGIPSIKKLAFPDFEGSIKSLGAWGGDFVMVRSDWDKKTLTNYFRLKGLNTLIPWDNMVLEDEGDL